MCLGEDVPDVFFLAMYQLKNPQDSSAKPSANASLIYSTIISLCADITPIPQVS